MKCKNCNFDNKEDAIFCKNCGERLNSKSTSNNSKTENKDDFLTYPKAEEDQGCITKAWYDIKSTDHWFRKLLLIALCNVVPILEFASTGYSLKWGTDAIHGKNSEMPKTIIDNQNIKQGFFEWVTWLAYGFVFIVATSILTSIFGRLWLIGTLLSIAIIVAKFFYDSFVSLGALKMSLDDKLSSSFDFKNLWTSYKKDLGSLLCAFFVPGIICSLIAIALCILFFAILAWTDLMFLISFFSQIQNTMLSASSTMYFLQVVSSIAVCIILCYISISFMAGIEKVIRYRAIGVYINRNCENWIK